MLQRFEKFVSVISGITRSLHRIMGEEMEKYGLRGSHAVYLVSMKKYPEGITAARLSEVCDKNKAAVSRALAELENKKLICKSGSHYRTQLFLTEEGKAAANFVCERAVVAVDLAGKGLTDEQREIFYYSIDTIYKNLDDLGNYGLPSQGKD